MKRAVVTGGGGFVGKAIVYLLKVRGIGVGVVGRNEYRDLADDGVMVHRGDIRDRDFLNKALAGYDTVFHVAAKAGIWGAAKEYRTINLDGTRNVMAACRVNGIGVLVHTSTPSVVFAGQNIEGGDESLPYSERFLCRYAETKAQAEREILVANSPGFLTVALRPHLVWGPGDTNLIPRLVERGRKGLLRQVGNGANRVDISYIDNVAEAHLLAADNLHSTATAAGKPYFISQGEPVNLWQWINEFLALVQVEPVVKKMGERRAWWIGATLELLYQLCQIKREPLMTRFLAEQLAHSHWFSIEAAKRDFNYSPRISIAQGMERTASWLTSSSGSV
ncbi:MAG: NAD-dependent epimerase/dehydratase family protein [Proteobacteria bacterium]|nr:NAD-dependent epimerase/dehydratase family protein [Pseudomonadota bacterium]MBU1686549.1 NAD-dependent epimerase/dehydratase family protein [Pseudomonadota bacterium]